jgi:hypothetical protein
MEAMGSKGAKIRAAEPSRDDRASQLRPSSSEWFDLQAVDDPREYGNFGR